MASHPTVQFDPPLKEVQKELKAIDARFAKELQRGYKAIAEGVRDKIREKYLSRHAGGSGKTAGTIRARATQNSASSVAGGPRAPYFMGQNFGSSGRWPQFPPRREPDYFVYESVGESEREIRELVEELLDRVYAEAFPEGAGPRRLGI